MRSIVDETPHIGSDEAGKGDFFGPLCVAALYADQEKIEILKRMEVKDSKLLSEKRLFLLADRLRADFQYDQIVLFPKKYNEIYPKFKNLNHLLAWAHAAVIDALHQRTDAKEVLVDQFTKEPLVSHYLKKRNNPIFVIEREKAESDLVVAGASILARSAFLEGLKLLEEEIGSPLPRGASTPVKQQARNLFDTHGKELFYSIAKLHFKTYKELF